VKLKWLFLVGGIVLLFTGFFWFQSNRIQADERQEVLSEARFALIELTRDLAELRLELQDLDDQLLLQQNALSVEAMLQASRVSSVFSRFQDLSLRLDPSSPDASRTFEEVESEYLDLIQQQKDYADALVERQNEFMERWWTLESYLEQSYIEVRDALADRQRRYDSMLVKVMTLSREPESDRINDYGTIPEYSRNHRSNSDHPTSENHK
jgi:hypothetical protein